jgi:hypothetical protein
LNNDTYACTYVEVLEILKHIPKEEYNKIPQEKIIFYENNKDKEYKFFYNGDNKVISRKAKTILINLYKNYIANLEEKTKIEEILKLNDIKLEIQKQKKYNVNELFKNKIKEQYTSLIEVQQKQKWYIKIYTFIKNIWLKNKKK